MQIVWSVVNTSKGSALDRKFVVPVRTELQVSPWEGPTGIRVASRHAVTDGSRTILFANPPTWTEEANCLNDWKAFDDGGVSSEVAKGLCSGCPVIDRCLSDAMAEEATLTPAFRSGVRGGLNTKERFALAVGDKSCDQGHLFKQFGKIRASGTPYCGECARMDDKRRDRGADLLSSRHDRMPCPRCKVTILKRNKSRHMKTADCMATER